MRTMLLLILAIAGASACTTVPASDGLVSVTSPHSVAVTVERLESLARERGLRVFLSLDHSAGAASVGETLAPTELVVFGNPKGGTPLMQCAQTIGIDLPLKALVWQDAAGIVHVTYNDLAAVAGRHGISACPAVARVSAALESLVGASVAPD